MPPSLPAMLKLRNIRAARKLLFISLSFVVPIAVLLYFTVTEVNKVIDLTRLELAGTAYVRPLGKLMKGIPEHELLARRMLSGEKGLDAQLAAKAAQVDDDFRALETVDRQYGLLLDFTAEGMGKRKRRHVTAQSLAQDWEELKSALPSLSPDACDARHMRIVDSLRTMITHVVDTSRLIIDPDLDSFYLINAAVVALPQAQYRLARSITFGYLALKKSALGAKDRTQFAIDAAMLKDIDYESTVSSVRTSLAEDAAFYGPSDSLQSNVPPALEKFMLQSNSFIDLLNSITTSESASVSAEDFLKAGMSAREAIYEFRRVLTDEVDRLLQVRLKATRFFRAWVLLLSLLTLVLAALLVARVAKSITGPLGACVQSLDALAAMDLTRRAEVGGTDELGKMAAAVARAVDELREAMQSIDHDAAFLSQASEGMVAASQEMSANAEETATQANVVSAAAEQVSKNVQTVSLATQEMGASIREVAQQATEAARVATTGVSVADTTNATVTKLAASSEEIGKVVKVITSIAEQTNLLALNATIEAARVGEAGRGFAVVANEVKELARETATATEEISPKIEAIQSDSREVVAAITQIGAIIKEINEIQGRIASAVEEQTVTTREIGRNVSEAAGGTSEIARNIMGVAEAARNTSEGAHHTRQASEELQRLARELKELVGRFKLED